MERVVHCMEEPFDVYIGRRHPRFPNGSKWACPFVVGEDGSRKEVLEKYRSWIIKQVPLIKSLGEIDGKTLGCWCKTKSDPKACHGDILVDLLRLRRKKLGLDRKSDRAVSSNTGLRKKLVKLPTGTTPAGLIQFMADQGVMLSVANGKINCQIPKTLNPAPFTDVIDQKEAYLLGAVGGCQSCKAGGRQGSTHVCCYGSYFLGKASRPQPAEVAGPNCPLNTGTII